MRNMLGPLPGFGVNSDKNKAKTNKKHLIPKKIVFLFLPVFLSFHFAHLSLGVRLAVSLVCVPVTVSHL